MSEVRDAEVLPAVVGSQALEIVGEREFSGYQGVATVTLNPDQVKQLQERMPEEAYDILPTGEVYVSQVHYRRLMNKVFKPGSWALIPLGPYAMNENTITREYALVGPGGRFISEAIGESEYQPNNDRMTYASACEAVKSNALTRCCKDLGIASECWDKRFCEEWKSQNAIAVWRSAAKQKKPQWRRRDAEPFWDETGEVKPRQHQGQDGQRPQQSVTEQPEPGQDEQWDPDDQGGEHEPPAESRASHSTPARRAPAGPKMPCPKCGEPAGPSQYPKEGRTHYCGKCRHMFAPGGGR